MEEQSNPPPWASQPDPLSRGDIVRLAIGGVLVTALIFWFLIAPQIITDHWTAGVMECRKTLSGKIQMRNPQGGYAGHMDWIDEGGMNHGYCERA